MKIISVPFVHTIGTKGAEEAPPKILSEVGVSEFEEIKVNLSDIEESNNTIHDRAKGLFEFGEDCVFVGGDHSITYPLFSAFSEKNSDCWLIVFDAHSDCDNASRNPTNEEWVRALVEDGYDPHRIILIGTRKVWGIEKEFIENSGIKVFTELEDVEAIGDYVTEKINGFPTYISVDIDALDPAYAPGTYDIEPDGLTSREFFYLVNRIFRTRGLKMLDVCEVVPPIDKKYDNRTIKLAAKLIQDFIGAV